ncbi:MAG: DMT family transporter [Acidovorax sp.]|nr:DMT family transporter [Acidovorax sp.]
MAGSEVAGALWVPVVLFAALAQTVRNAAQRSLTGALGTTAATLVRFLYGLPFAALWLLVLCATGQGGLGFALPAFSTGYFAWIALGAAFQIAATAALLLAMKERNFAVAVTLSKTEVLQVALFAAVFLHEIPTPLAAGAMALATAGVVVLSWPRGGWRGQGWARPALYGLACGACFAIATVGFRGAALALQAPSPWLSGAWGVLVAQALQSLALGLWVARRHPEGLRPVLRAWRVSLLAGSMGAAASLAWFTAYAMQGAAAVRTLGMVEVVFSYVVSRRVFSERLSRPEAIGMALVVLGLALVCLQG